MSLPAGGRSSHRVGAVQSGVSQGNLLFGDRLTLFSPKARLMQEGSPACYVFRISAGIVSLSTLLANGHRQIYEFRRTGDFLGAPGHVSYSCTASAVTQVAALRMDRIQMQEAIGGSRNLMTTLMEITSGELAAARRHIVTLGQRSATEKVANFILASRVNALDGGPSNIVELPGIVLRIWIAGLLICSH